MHTEDAVIPTPAPKRNLLAENPSLYSVHFRTLEENRLTDIAPYWEIVVGIAGPYDAVDERDETRKRRP